MKALDRKLIRDLARIWAQTLAIALVLGCGIMVLVGTQITARTLSQTMDAYYERQRFADIFATATRAPRTLLEEIARIDGVALTEGRIGFPAILDIDGMEAPASARVLSLPAEGALVNLPALRRGALPDPERPDEVALSEPFALAHGLVPGSRLRGVIGGQLRELTVSGWVLSPEFLFTQAPGALMPDDRRFGIVWMTESAAAAARNMAGAFNDVAMTLSRDADPRAVIQAVDDILAPYGGTGAHGRDRQMSHAFLAGEMSQLQAMATFVPPIFLIVAAFLVNMVLGRLISQERSQIGLFKAMGYSTATIAWHYLKLALLIGVTGVLLGWAFGVWIAEAMIGLYQDYFRFPYVLRDPAAGALAGSAALGLGVAILGGLRAVWSSVRLPAAEAMSPPAPPAFSRGALDRAIAGLRLRQTTMMILRSILRWPGRAAITLFGVSASVAVLVMSYFLFDAVTLLADTVFGQANRQQVTLVLASPQGERAVSDARVLPGVSHVEPGFAVPVRLTHGQHSRLSALQGHAPTATLARLIDDHGQVVTLPAQGMVLPEMLARALSAAPGDVIQVELLVPPRDTLDLPVAAVVAQGLGQEAHIAASALYAALGTAPQVTHLHLSVDPHAVADLNAAIKGLTQVSGLVDWAEVRRQFDQALGENLLVMVGLYTLIGVLIAVGVIYNAARIQLSERSHELASLRVLGFTRAEVGFVLIGEMMLLTAVAIVPGWILGTFLAQGLVSAVSTDIMQMPYVITRRTYALAALAAGLASLFSVLLVRRRLDRVDMVSALKARD